MAVHSILDKIWVKYRILLTLRVGVLAIALLFLFAALLSLFISLDFLVFSLVASSVLALGLLLYYKSINSNRKTALTKHWNTQIPDFEYSVELLLKEKKGLSYLQHLQQQKIAGIFLEQYAVLTLPIAWKKTLLYTFKAVALAILLLQSNVSFPIPDLQQGITASPQASNEASILDVNTKKSTPIQLLHQQLHLVPPAYTGIPPSTTKKMDVKAIEGSKLTWTWTFNQALSAANLLLNNDKKIALTPNGNTLTLKDFLLLENGFYALEFRGQDGETKISDYYKLVVIKDVPPIIEVNNLKQYSEFRYDTSKTISIQAQVSDDYGLSKLYLVTTVSRGAGESVKFANDTLALSPKYTSPRAASVGKTLHLHQLGMEPGDELYFHLEALDNKTPDPQITRTFKYIAVFEDTLRIKLDVSGSIAVSQMPEFFRSQRQIIIDTENLIASQKKKTTKEFNDNSESIGIDQKMLRLRYGKFLGEESVTKIGPRGKEEPAEQEEEHDHEEHHDHHNHDHEEHHDHIEHHDHDDHHDHEEHHEHEEHDHEEEEIEMGHEHGHEHEGHDHGTEGEEQDEVAKLLEPYVHAHDNVEEATFFDGSTKAKLRAALSFMWDAELQLRLHQPKKALPYEHKALKLIKEIQQANRVYVERAGFEPPVIKVTEKRLKGELDDIHEATSNKKAGQNSPFSAIEASIPLLERLKQENRFPSATEQGKLQTAGNELAGIILSIPGQHLLALRQLRALLDKDIPKPKLRQGIQLIQQAFLKIVPDKSKEAKRKPMVRNRLNRIYLQQLR